MKKLTITLLTTLLFFSCKKEEKEQESTFNKLKGNYSLISQFGGYHIIKDALIIDDSIYFKNEGTFAYTYYAINDLIPIKVKNKPAIDYDYVYRNDTIVYPSFYNFDPSVTPYYYVKQ